MMHLSSRLAGGCFLSSRGLSAKVRPCCLPQRSFRDSRRLPKGWLRGLLCVLFAKNRATCSYFCRGLERFGACSHCSSLLDSILRCGCFLCSASCQVTIRRPRFGQPLTVSAR